MVLLPAMSAAWRRETRVLNCKIIQGLSLDMMVWVLIGTIASSVSVKIPSKESHWAYHIGSLYMNSQSTILRASATRVF